MYLYIYGALWGPRDPIYGALWVPRVPGLMDPGPRDPGLHPNSLDRNSHSNSIEYSMGIVLNIP